MKLGTVRLPAPGRGITVGPLAFAVLMQNPYVRVWDGALMTGRDWYGGVALRLLPVWLFPPSDDRRQHRCPAVAVGWRHWRYFLNRPAPKWAARRWARQLEHWDRIEASR